MTIEKLRPTMTEQFRAIAASTDPVEAE